MSKRPNNAGGKPQQRSDGRWHATVSLPDGRRRYVYGRTQSEVLAKQRDVLDRIHGGMAAVDARTRLGDYLETWISTTLATSDRKPKTKADRASLLRTHVVPMVGRVRLDQLRAEHIRRVLVSMEANGKSSNTRRNVYNALKSALDDAVADGLLARSPMASVKRPSGETVEPAESKHIEPSDVARILRAAQGTRWEQMLVVMVSVGLRRGEVLGLHWADVDLGSRTLTVRRTIARVDGQGIVVSSPKTERSRRTIVLPEIAVRALARQREIQELERMAGTVWADERIVFASEVGTYVEPRAVNRALDRLARQAGVAKANPHRWRHSFATLLLSHGTDTATVSEALGHRSPVVTASIYSHVLEENRAKAATLMDDLLTPTLTPTEPDAAAS